MEINYGDFEQAVRRHFPELRDEATRAEQMLAFFSGGHEPLLGEVRWLSQQNHDAAPCRKTAEWLLQIEGDYIYDINGTAAVLPSSVMLYGRSLFTVPRTAEMRAIAWDGQWVVTTVTSGLS